MKFKQGDYVKIISREATPADTKKGSYYPHFGGLAGTVDRIYDDEVCINVDQETLPEGVLKRHLDIQESIRRKWLNGLSGEARNKLSPEEKQFQLSYTMLVQTIDLEKAKPGKPKPAEIKSVEPLNPPTDSTKPEESSAPKAESVTAKSASKSETDKPVSSKDLEAAETAFLKEREQALKQNNN